MDASEWVFVAGALFVGLALGILAVLPFALRRRRKDISHNVLAEEYPAPGAARAARPPPPAPAPSPPREFDEFTVVSDPLRAPPAMPHAPPTAPPRAVIEESAIPTEWARRLVGPLEPGRAKGICSGCGTKLSVSMQRPLRIACPVCGRQRLLT